MAEHLIIDQDGNVEGETIDLATFAELDTRDMLIEIYRVLKAGEETIREGLAQASSVVESVKHNPMLSAFLG